MNELRKQIARIKAIALMETAFLPKESPFVFENMTSRRYAELIPLVNKLNAHIKANGGSK